MMKLHSGMACVFLKIGFKIILEKELFAFKSENYIPTALLNFHGNN